MAVVPSDSLWLFGDAEADHRSGLMVRLAFAANLRDERPRESLGYLAAGYRWRGLYELGVAGIFASGQPSGGTRAIRAAGPGVYVGFGTPAGLRLTLLVGSVLASDTARRTSAMAMAYEFQVPVLAAARLRLNLANRGAFSFSEPTVFVHRIQIEAILDRRWKLFAGIAFDPDPGVAFGAGLSF